MSTSSSSEDECKISEDDFEKILKEATKDLGLNPEQIVGLRIVKKINKRYQKDSWIKSIFKVLGGIVGVCFILAAISFYLVVKKSTLGKKIAKLIIKDVDNDQCVVPAAEGVVDYFRPPVDCNLCKDVTGLTVVENITPEEFHKKFAFTMKPLLVKGGQKDWNAKNIFSMDYFRSIYPKKSQALRRVQSDCQFFPYKTNFNSLGEVLQMSKEREEGRGKPWYIGWSNCDGLTANELRKHYKKPSFLPSNYEHARTDWIFMGLPGYGAHMHIDAIDIMSWQAQIRGIKKWVLMTPPECFGICPYKIEIVVEPGDIVVLDTNRWFHSTEIIGNETSIVIGSEYF